ncbi:MAG: FRG domain-containing protein [Syntrophorhabdales bacterium]|jgi:hypothetical protein
MIAEIPRTVIQQLLRTPIRGGIAMVWNFENSDATEFERTEKTIASVSDFVDCVQSKWEQWRKRAFWKQPPEMLPWFRGVERESYKLIPSIYRGEEDIGWEYNENEAVDMRAEFARRAKPFITRSIPYGSGEYLHLMQHYRFPTRLLDWTEGALIALYFAIRIPGKDNNPCVWMLNPSWLNYRNDVTTHNQATGEDKSLILYTDCDAIEEFSADKVIRDNYLDEHNLARLPVAVFPPHIDPRIVAQKSVFTIHGSEKDGFGLLLDQHTVETQICKLRITSDAEEIKNVTEALNMLGMTETTIFPDLEGLSREIQAEYKMPLKGF